MAARVIEKGTGELELERRILVLAPTGKDASLTCSVLADADIACTVCADMDGLVAELERGAAAVLLAVEATGGDPRALAHVIARQQPWSDLPVLLLVRQGGEPESESLSRIVGMLGNALPLERPLRVAALQNAVRNAMRARDRQYRARAYLEERDRAVRALQEADRRKDEFLATLAHELRNPLAPIRNAVHILRLTAAGDPALYEMMERQVGYMVRLVDDLLEVSRITRGKIELKRERVALATVIQAAVETTRPLIEVAAHDFRVECPEEPLMVEADPVRLAQVFANLLNNSAKYTDRGGRIVLRATREGSAAVVTVSDNGVGIPAAALPRVFDMFMQGDAVDSRGGGLGIGLTLARTLAEMHGGSVTARSEGPGQGSEFIVRLPLALDAGGPPRRGEGHPAPGPREETRVLVVDDSRDGADSLRVLLELLGADVQVAYNGADALEAVQVHRPQIVLLDIGMPGMDGFEVARRIRRQSSAAAATLVALTGWGQPADHRNSRAAGFDHHLIKPVDMEALQTLLRAVHGARR